MHQKWKYWYHSVSKKCTYWPLGFESEPPIAPLFGIWIVVRFVSTFVSIFSGPPHIPHVTSSPKHPIVEIVCIITHAVFKQNIASKKRNRERADDPKVWQTRSTVAFCCPLSCKVSRKRTELKPGKDMVKRWNNMEHQARVGYWCTPRKGYVISTIISNSRVWTMPPETVVGKWEKKFVSFMEVTWAWTIHDVHEFKISKEVSNLAVVMIREQKEIFQNIVFGNPLAWFTPQIGIPTVRSQSRQLETECTFQMSKPLFSTFQSRNFWNLGHPFLESVSKNNVSRARGVTTNLGRLHTVSLVLEITDNHWLSLRRQL